MKALFIIFSLHFCLTSHVEASGCGRYDNYREITTTQPVKVLDLDDYLIESKTEKTITLKEKATDKKITLGWEKTELIEDRIQDADSEDALFLTSFVANDALFEEGNGCGPVFRCVTGQVKMKLSNPKKRETMTFSYPIINAFSSDTSIEYLMDSPLLPIFGNLKLDVISLKESEASNNQINNNQCGYGDW